MALSNTLRDHSVAFISELFGTFLFLFFAFVGVQTANQPTALVEVSNGPSASRFLFVAAIFGVSLAVNFWIFFRVSGGLFNPAVALALLLVRKITIVRAGIMAAAQIVAGVVASLVVRSLIPGDTILFNVSLSVGVTNVQGLFLEGLFTFELVFTILMLAAEKTKATFLAPVGIGFALFVTQTTGIFWTGAGVNPARAFGPDLVMLRFSPYHWIYWLGPVLGALFAAAFYRLLKLLHYEEVNGDQDKASDDGEFRVEKAEEFTDRLRMYGSQSSMLKQSVESSTSAIPHDLTELQPLTLYPLAGLGSLRDKHGSRSNTTNFSRTWRRDL